jgi:proteasome accessory factor B
MRKVERLINLIALLMDTRRPLTGEQIRAAIYGDQSDVAFRRMFERDKEELRELGLPVDRAATDVWETEEGYLIRPEEATVPELDLTPDEQAALWLAARAWQGEAGGENARRALLKLSAAEGSPGPDDVGWLAPRVEASAPNLPALLDAVARRKRVRFAYRTGGGGPAAARRVEPHALSYRGGWYLTGRDTKRKAVRHFKLSRIDGPVVVEAGDRPDFKAPSGPAPEIPRGPWQGESTSEARVAFGPRSAWWVERRTGARRVAERANGWVELAVPVADPAAFVSWILGFADDAEILGPPNLRAAITMRLKELL